MSILVYVHFGTFSNFKHYYQFFIRQHIADCFPAKDLFGKVFADRGYISKGLFEDMFDRGIHIVHGLKANMKNKLMPMWDKIMLRKRYVIECINHLLKDKANLVHSRHRSLHNFIINFCSALMAYSFFDNKPQALQVKIEKDDRQLTIF